MRVRASFARVALEDTLRVFSVSLALSEAGVTTGVEEGVTVGVGLAILRLDVTLAARDRAVTGVDAGAIDGL